MTTPTSQLLKTVAKFRADLLAEEAKAVATLEHYYSYTVMSSIKPKLDKIYSQILQKIEAGEPIPQSWIYQRIHQENLQLLIEGQIDQYSALALQQTRMLQRTGVELGLESAKKQVDTVVPSEMRALINKYLPASKQVKAVFGMPSETAIQGLIGATQSGSPLHTLFNGWGKEASDKAIKALVSGVTNGDNPRTIAPRVAKELNISRNRALTITHNEIMRAYRGAALESYRSNSDVLEYWIWSCDLYGDRTCLACILMNGTVHPLDEDMASHTRCRCSPIPKTKTFADILSGLDIDTSEIPETSVSLPSGEDWLLQQSDERQRAAFNSQSAYDLWKSDSGIQLQDFIGYNRDKEWGDSVRVKSVKELVNT